MCGARVYAAGARVYASLVIIGSAQVLWVLTLGLWTLDLGLTISWSRGVEDRVEETSWGGWQELRRVPGGQHLTGAGHWPDAGSEHQAGGVRGPPGLQQDDHSAGDSRIHGCGKKVNYTSGENFEVIMDAIIKRSIRETATQTSRWVSWPSPSRSRSRGKREDARRPRWQSTRVKTRQICSLSCSTNWTRSKGSVNLPQGSVNLVVICKVY